MEDYGYMPPQPPMTQENVMVENSPVSLGSQGSETIRWLEDTEDIIKELELTLLNREIVIENNREVIKDRKHGKPYMNSDGVNRVLSIIRSHFHRGITLSNFKDMEIQRIMEILHLKIAFMIGHNHESFQIEKGNLNTIQEIITNVIYSTFKRAYNEGERIMFGRTQRGTETKVVGENQKRGLSKLFPF